MVAEVLCRFLSACTVNSNLFESLKPVIQPTQNRINPILRIGFITLLFTLPSSAQNPEVLELRAALGITRQKLAHTEAQRLAAAKALAESVRISEEQTFAARAIQEKMEAFRCRPLFQF